MTADLQLDSIGQIHISVTDVPRAVAFYRDVLGMKLLFEVPGQPMAFFDCGGIRLYLGIPSSPEFTSNALIYYRVRDIQSVYEELTEKGVEFRNPPQVAHKAEDHELWLAGFQDSEGNPLVLMEEVPVASPPVGGE